MTLPIDLFLVRHGQSEGNVARRRSEAGDHTAYTEEFRDRHSASFRLSTKGREQAKQAGRYLRKHYLGNGSVFDRYYTSEYIRAVETAGLLDLPNADWFRDVYLTERDWGELDVCPENERAERFGAELRRREIEPFFWRPPNGESFMQLCMRVDRVLETLHRECSDKRVILVCHGEVMRAFQVRIERLSQERFRELVFSERPEDRIHNCQITHYTRRHPVTHKIFPYTGWVSWARPTDEPPRVSDWQKIERPHYTNKDLLDMAARVKAVVT